MILPKRPTFGQTYSCPMSRRGLKRGLIWAVIAAVVVVVVGGVHNVSLLLSSPCDNNLLNCGHPVPINEPSSSVTHVGNSVEVNFNNMGMGSGVAFQLVPAQDVRDFPRVQIEGKSSQPFNFEVEYKRKSGNELQKVATSARRLFPAGENVVKVPLAYDGAIDEVALNFYVANEYSTLRIDSIRLVPFLFSRLFALTALIAGLVQIVILGVLPLLNSRRLERKLKPELEDLIDMVRKINSAQTIDNGSDQKLVHAEKVLEVSKKGEYVTLMRKLSDFNSEVERQRENQQISDDQSHKLRDAVDGLMELIEKSV